MKYNQLPCIGCDSSRNFKVETSMLKNNIDASRIVTGAYTSYFFTETFGLD